MLQFYLLVQYISVCVFTAFSGWQDILCEDPCSVGCADSSGRTHEAQNAYQGESTHFVMAVVCHGLMSSKMWLSQPGTCIEMYPSFLEDFYMTLCLMLSVLFDW